MAVRLAAKYCFDLSLTSRAKVIAVHTIGSYRKSTCGSHLHYDRKPYKVNAVDLDNQSYLMPDGSRASRLNAKPGELVAEIPGAPEVQTVFQFLEFGLKVSNDGDCFGSKPPSAKEYKWSKYSEAKLRSMHVGSGLIELGIQPKHNAYVGIFSSNREEFLLTLFGAAGYSMVLVPLYNTLGTQSVLFIINQAKLNLIIADTNENALKVLTNSNQLPTLKTVIVMDEMSSEVRSAAQQKNIKLISFKNLEELGQKNKKELILPDLDDLFCIPYTSGTTGTPKGVMITHKNFLACVSSLVIAYGDAGLYGGTIVSFLPPAHIYEICNEIMSLYFARRVAFYSGDIKNLMEEMQKLKPTVLPYVPRILNAIYTNVMEKSKESYIKSFLLKFALSRKEKLLKKGIVTSKSIWDKLFLKKFQEFLGGHAHMIITTSAPLSAEVSRFFRCASGAYFFEAYGQTEVTAGILTLPHETSGGYQGTVLPCNYVKLVDAPEMGYFAKDNVGEVCFKGHNVFKGYFMNTEATNESLKDGWQHSGDIGRWLPNGALQIIDRKKHIFKMSQGEYIAPEKVENVYSQSQLVAQIYVEGLSDKDYVVAIILPEMSRLKKWCKSKGHDDSKEISELLQDKDVRRDFLLELHKLGKHADLNSLEQARNLTFITVPFSVENDLMTPTLKLRRNTARKEFDAQLKEMYEEGPLIKTMKL